MANEQILIVEDDGVIAARLQGILVLKSGDELQLGSLVLWVSFTG